MKINRPMMFLEPDDASLAGGGGDAPASATRDPWSGGGDDHEDNPSGDVQGGDPNPNPTPPPAPTALDPKVFEAFGQSFAKTFAESQREQQRSLPAAPPTPEQIAQARKELAFFEIDDNFIKNFGNLETQKSTLEAFRDGLTKHILTVVNHLRQNDRSEYEKTFTEKFTPVEQMLSERHARETQSRFNTRFPQFAGPDLEPAVEAAVGHLAKTDGFAAKPEAEKFKAVAELLTAQAKRFNPQFVLEDVASSGSAGPSSTRSGNSIPVTSGGSGASLSTNGAPAKKGWALSHMK